MESRHVELRVVPLRAAAFKLQRSMRRSLGRLKLERERREHKEREEGAAATIQTRVRGRQGVKAAARRRAEAEAALVLQRGARCRRARDEAGRRRARRAAAVAIQAILRRRAAVRAATALQLEEALERATGSSGCGLSVPEQLAVLAPVIQTAASVLRPRGRQGPSSQAEEPPRPAVDLAAERSRLEKESTEAWDAVATAEAAESAAEKAMIEAGVQFDLFEVSPLAAPTGHCFRWMFDAKTVVAPCCSSDAGRGCRDSVSRGRRC